MTKAIDRLFDISDAEDVILAGNQRDDGILDIIGILKLIDHDDGETLFVFFCGSLLIRLQDL